MKKLAAIIAITVSSLLLTVAPSYAWSNGHNSSPSAPEIDTNLGVAPRQRVLETAIKRHVLATYKGKTRTCLSKVIFRARFSANLWEDELDVAAYKSSNSVRITYSSKTLQRGHGQYWTQLDYKLAIQELHRAGICI